MNLQPRVLEYSWNCPGILAKARCRFHNENVINLVLSLARDTILPDTPSELPIFNKKSVNLQPGVLEYYWLCLGTVTKARDRFHSGYSINLVLSLARDIIL